MVWVAAQAVLFGLIIFLPLESQFSLSYSFTFIAFVLSAIGLYVLMKAIYDLRRSLRVSPVPAENGKLQTKGIYSWVRHPMYLSVWLLLGSSVLLSGSYTKLFLLAGLIVFFVSKATYEERLLKKKYPGYDKYIKRVGAFLPKVKRRKT